MTVEVITRESIPAVYETVVKGRAHNLGVLKEFKQHERVREFMPKDMRVAMAWVHLNGGEVLASHVHPVDSMIVLAKGSGRAIGDLDASLNEGDIVLVEAGSLHGFIGEGDGFWGLSLQFDSRGLYEDLGDPWVAFSNEREVLSSRSLDSLPLVDALMERNRWFEERFATHRLFTLAREGRLADPEVQRRMLDCLQVWSSCFQQIVIANASLAREEPFVTLTQRHLREERGHDQALAAARTDLHEIWDPLLEGACSWFFSQTLNGTDEDRVVLTHLVAEAAALVFYPRMTPVFADSPTAEHFRTHLEDDQEHVIIGVEALQQARPESDRAHLFRLQQQGWDMFHALFHRVVELIIR